MIQSQLNAHHITSQLTEMINLGHFWLNIIEIHEKSNIANWIYNSDSYFIFTRDKHIYIYIHFNIDVPCAVHCTRV